MKKVFRPIGLFLLSGIFCTPSQVHAADNKPETALTISQQKKQVTGTVVDEFGPVAGASVSVKGTNEGTITDMDGNFSLTVSQGATISISFIGYVPQEIKYTGQTSLAIQLVEDTQNLDEVVVTAMGIKGKTRLKLCHERTQVRGYPTGSGTERGQLTVWKSCRRTNRTNCRRPYGRYEDSDSWYQLRRR